MSLQSREYADLVSSYSTLSAGNSLYPRSNLRDLASYLKQPYHNTVLSPASRPTVVSDSRLSVSLYEFGSRDVSTTTIFADIAELEQHIFEHDCAVVNGRLLLLRGTVSPSWLNAIGAKFNVDPEVFHQHMDHSATGQSNYFATPVLPSAATKLTKFRLVTIGARMRTKTSSGTKLQKVRERARKAWDAYLENLRRDRMIKANMGSSVVRDFSIHDEEFFSIEQNMTVSIDSFAGKWFVLVWLDIGRDLGTSPAGPWMPDFFGLRHLQVNYYPTIQRPEQSCHEEMISLDEALGPIVSSRSSTTDLSIPQSASFLHREIGKRLSDKTINHPIDAMCDIIKLSTSSELQYLNLVRTVVGNQLDLSRSENVDSDELSTLLYHRQKLKRHIIRLQENQKFIKHHLESQDSLSRGSGATSKVGASSLTDFHHLERVAQDLAAECDVGMGVLTNQAMMKESQKAIIQAESVANLTRLAFIYIPLSFTSSFFGMNFTELTSGASRSIWIWFVTSIPILLISLAVTMVDIPQLLHQLRN